MVKYEMRDLGELHWFLNVKVLRDRRQRKLWLSQSAYIDKIVASSPITILVVEAVCSGVHDMA